MALLLNILFGVLAFFGIRYVMLQMHASMVIATIVGVITGIVVFLANLGGQVLAG